MNWEQNLKPAIFFISTYALIFASRIYFKSLYPSLQLSVLKVPNAESEETDTEPHQRDQNEGK